MVNRDYPAVFQSPHGSHFYGWYLLTMTQSSP